MVNPLRLFVATYFNTAFEERNGFAAYIPHLFTVGYLSLLLGFEASKSTVTFHFKTVSMFLLISQLPVGHVSSSGNEFLTALKCELIVGGTRTHMLLQAGPGKGPMFTNFITTSSPSHDSRKWQRGNYSLRVHFKTHYAGRLRNGILLRLSVF
jgi:hypothetical protein